VTLGVGSSDDVTVWLIVAEALGVELPEPGMVSEGLID